MPPFPQRIATEPRPDGSSSDRSWIDRVLENAVADGRDADATSVTSDPIMAYVSEGAPAEPLPDVFEIPDAIKSAITTPEKARAATPAVAPAATPGAAPAITPAVAPAITPAVAPARTPVVAPARTTPPTPEETTAQSTSTGRSLWVFAAIGVFVITLGGFGAFVRSRDRAGIVGRSAQLTVNTVPAGADVIIDAERRGVTPVTLAINPGDHSLTLRLNGIERVMPLTIAAGSEVSQYLEMPTAALRSAVGRIFVATDPAGARVTVDGIARGVSPVTVADLTATDHRVRVVSAAGTADRVVTVESGGNTSVVFSLSKKPDGPVAGWLTVAAPFEVQVLEHDELVGAGGTAKTRIMLTEGRHDVILTNRSLEYQESRRIEVAPGQVTTLTVVPPSATVSVNARPWADLTIDGKDVGQTPISNLRVPIGTHQVIFRHPEFGERRQTIVVTAKGPNRFAVDLTK